MVHIDSLKVGHAPGLLTQSRELCLWVRRSARRVWGFAAGASGHEKSAQPVAERLKVRRLRRFETLYGILSVISNGIRRVSVILSDTQ
jgi:hypothetical protein